MPGQQHSSLSSRDLIGLFWNRYEDSMNKAMINSVAMYSPSDQEMETYNSLGASPVMREWIGGRQAKGFRENPFTIENKTFESTVEVKVNDLRREKYGQIRSAIGDMGRAAAGHSDKLLSELILTGESALCYDGQPFFSNTHVEGNSGTQSNDIGVTINTLPIDAANLGTTTAPGAETMAALILLGVQQFYGFKNDQGEPINQSAMSFGIHVPTTFMAATLGAVKNSNFASQKDNTIQTSGLSFQVFTDPRLTWTDKFAMYILDSEIKPFIHQEELPTELSSVAEGTEYEFINDAHLYGTKRIHNVGFGDWRRALLIDLN